MKFLQCNLGEKLMKSVGLIIGFALLFFCVMQAWKNQNKLVSFAQDCISEYILVNKNKEEVSKPVKEEPKKPVVDPDKPMIALTFDDGPSIYTDEILNILKANDARATFFVLGLRAAGYTEEIAKMEALHCEIGNHTYNHLNMTTLAPEQISMEIAMTNEAIRKTVGYDAKLVRPPYGEINAVVMENISYPVALWSVDTTDWQLKDANAVAQHILSTVQDGDVVLLHDIYSTTLEAMRIIIPELKARGYQLVTFSEMAEAHNVTLENRQKYFNFK